MNIVLIGMPSSGKSTTGKILAEKLGKKYIDMDAEIERILGARIPDIFEEKGEEFFRNAETRLAKKLSRRKNTIISTGGGIIKNEYNIRVLSKNGIIVWLNRDLPLLQSSDYTPLSRTREALEKLYYERLPLYRQYADLTADANGSSEQTAENIIDLLDNTEKTGTIR